MSTTCALNCLKNADVRNRFFGCTPCHYASARVYACTCVYVRARACSCVCLRVFACLCTHQRNNIYAEMKASDPAKVASLHAEVHSWLKCKGASCKPQTNPQ